MKTFVTVPIAVAPSRMIRQPRLVHYKITAKKSLLKRFQHYIEVGFSITTADERMRKIFEPGAPPIKERINALKVLHSKGIKTFAMIAPILPGAEGLVEELADKVDHILIDRLNYFYANRIYIENKMEWAKEEPFFIQKSNELKRRFEERGIAVRVLF